MPSASIKKNIPCSKKDIIEMVLDIEKYPEFVPWCLEGKINDKIFTKSGIMLGLGETRNEVLQVMDDLLAANVDFLTIGQYLQPSVKHYPLDRYIHPNEFAELKSVALSKGFLIVASSPLTRSSYHADEDFSKMKKLREKKTVCHLLQ